MVTLPERRAVLIQIAVRGRRLCVSSAGLRLMRGGIFPIISLRIQQETVTALALKQPQRGGGGADGAGPGVLARPSVAPASEAAVDPAVTVQAEAAELLGDRVGD